MKKILIGAILAAAAYYYFHPQDGAARRKKLSGMWGSHKDDVLDAARNTSSAVAGVSQEVGGIVGTKIAELRSEGDKAGDKTNGNVLTGAASTKPAKS